MKPLVAVGVAVYLIGAPAAEGACFKYVVDTGKCGNIGEAGDGIGKMLSVNSSAATFSDHVTGVEYRVGPWGNKVPIIIRELV